MDLSYMVEPGYMAEAHLDCYCGSTSAHNTPLQRSSALWQGTWKIFVSGVIREELHDILRQKKRNKRLAVVPFARSSW